MQATNWHSFLLWRHYEKNIQTKSTEGIPLICWNKCLTDHIADWSVVQFSIAFQMHFPWVTPNWHDHNKMACVSSLLLHKESDSSFNESICNCSFSSKGNYRSLRIDRIVTTLLALYHDQILNYDVSLSLMYP